MHTRSFRTGMKSALAAGVGVLSLGLLLSVSAPDASAESSFFNNTCADCHTDDTPTCNACHEHRGSISATADMSEYDPGSLVTITLDGGRRSGWIRGLLYDDQNTEVDRASGPSGTGDDGLGNPVVFPVTLQATAPTEPGQYTWQAAWYGSVNNGTNHGEVRTPVTITVADNTSDAGDDDSSTTYRFEGWGTLKRQYR